MTPWTLETRALNTAPRVLSMSGEPLPPDVSAFIRDHRLTPDEMEALSAMSDAPGRWWDAKSISGEIGVPLSIARGILDHLAALNLLDIRVTDEVRYRFQPGTDGLGRTISQLVSLYRTDRAAVVRALAPAARRGVLDFADAFRWRKSNGNG